MSDQKSGDHSSDNLIGQNKSELSTPSLCLELNIFEANLQKMSEHVKRSGIGLRPHAKSHKCPQIALRQVNSGALGVCAATIREAEAMSRAGVNGILITSEMVGRHKIDRLLALTSAAPDTMSVVDNPRHVEELDDAAGAAGVRPRVLIDMDLGLRRTGVGGVDAGVSLAEKICRTSSLSAHVAGFEERRAHSLKSMEPAVELLSRLRRSGMPAEILSGGSTGTYNIDPEMEGMTELQAGSYIFMDVDYHMIGGKTGSEFDDFGFSLSVIASVISKSHDGVATVDAGFKALATDRPFGPELKGRPGVKYHFGGDEHGILEIRDGEDNLRVGDRLEFFVPHCDPTVNLYDRIHCIRNDRIEAVWGIARGYQNG